MGVTVNGRWVVLAGGPRGVIGTADTLEEAEALAEVTTERVGIRMRVQPNPVAVAQALGVEDPQFVRQLRMALKLDGAGLLRR